MFLSMFSSKWVASHRETPTTTKRLRVSSPEPISIYVLTPPLVPAPAPGLVNTAIQHFLFLRTIHLRLLYDTGNRSTMLAKVEEISPLDLRCYCATIVTFAPRSCPTVAVTVKAPFTPGFARTIHSAMPLKALRCLDVKAVMS